MLKNYFLVAIRNFWRNKIFSLINILGLSIGISASLVIFLLVYYDFSFDKSLKDRDRIYRVVTDGESLGNSYHWPNTCEAMVGAIERDLTGIGLVVPFHTADGIKVTVPHSGITSPLVLKKQEDVIYTDGRYFDLLHHTWLAGSPSTSLKEPYRVVLTESNAHRYYAGINNADIIGKTIFFDDTIQATITGIVKDIAYNTDFYFKTFISRATLLTSRLKPICWDQWGCYNSADQLFLRLAPGISAKRVTPQLNGLLKKYSTPDPDNHSIASCGLQPLADLHFNTSYGVFDESRQASKSTLYGLLAVAVFLLLLACINFINLTTAQASQRAKEIGVRKTLGSLQRQLAFQFLNETFLLTVISTGLSILMTPLLLRVFADFIPKEFHFSLFGQPIIFLFLFTLILVVSVLAGLYPALVLAAFKPVLVLKNQAYANTGKTRTAWLRKSLTVFQFVIAQVFIIATLLVGKQISYELNKDMGFNKEAILYFNTNYSETRQKRNLLLDKLRSLSGIAMVSVSTDLPSSGSTMSSTLKYNDGKKDIVEEVQIKKADSNYFRLYGFHMLAGTGNPQSDTVNSLVINEAYAHDLGFTDPQQALGKQIKWEGNPRIVGVVANFHQKSLHEMIKPIVIANGTNEANCINIALRPQNTDGTAWISTIGAMEKAFKSVYPNDDFDYHFVDDTIAKFYTEEKNTGRLLRWSTGLTIFISCLGLLGLIIYITNQRTKEIGIRKVLGASIAQIIVLLSRDFVKLLSLAILIALPIAWWGSHKWLESYAYRTALSWWIFVAGGGFLLLVAIIVLGLHAFRAAVANPVESLRTE